MEAVTDFIADIVGRLRDETGFSVLYHEIPTWAEPTPTPLPSRPDNETKTSSDSEPKVDVAASIILYIGEESLTLTNLLMTHPSSRVNLAH